MGRDFQLWEECDFFPLIYERPKIQIRKCYGHFHLSIQGHVPIQMLSQNYNPEFFARHLYHIVQLLVKNLFCVNIHIYAYGKIYEKDPQISLPDIIDYITYLFCITYYPQTQLKQQICITLKFLLVRNPGATQLVLWLREYHKAASQVSARLQSSQSSAAGDLLSSSLMWFLAGFHSSHAAAQRLPSIPCHRSADITAACF